MRMIPYYLMLLLITTACTSNLTDTIPNIKSWEIVKPNELNKNIQQAYKGNLTWVNKPELYVFNLIDLTNLRKIAYEYSADNIESPKNIYISIMRDGFLDDSVRGDIQKIKLSKNSKGKWKVISIKKAISCWRRDKLIYSSELCP